MLTIGQYLALSESHLSVNRFVPPSSFEMFAAKAYEMGFKHVAAAPMVRSSYQAAHQADLATQRMR